MHWPRTIQARLTFGYAIAFAVGLTIFAVTSFASLDAALKAVIDSRVQSAETLMGRIVAADAAVGHATRERLDLVTGTNLSSVVFAEDGRAVYSSASTIAPAMRALVLQADNTPHLATFRIGGLAGRIVTQRILTMGGRYRYLGVWRQLDLVESLEAFRIVSFTTAAVLICLSAVLVGTLVARQGLRPLRAMAQLAEEIEAHDLSRRLDLRDDRSELGQLAATFDKMLARLEGAFERQRRFTADASHELRAPLAVVHVAADLALRREREPAAYQRVLTSILRATQQLEALTDHLLLAARADAGYVNLERLDLSALLSDTLEQLTPLAESKRVRLVAAVQNRAFVNVDRAGVARAIIALVDNAIKFSPEGGEVTASVTSDAERVRLAVEDDGPGFSDEGLQHATDRFWRSDPARAPGSGSGLGLAICDSIVRASGGSLIPQNAAGRGACVLLEFPAAV